MGESVPIGNNVAVIGGGITALDAAAIARRLGAENVFLILDRPKGELPAYHWEVAAAESEGIRLYEKTVASQIFADKGKVTAIEITQTNGEELILPVDTIIGTVSQYSDLRFLSL